MLFTDSVPADALGVVAAAVAMAMSALGYVLAKSWSAGAGVLASASRQLLGGGLLLPPFAVAASRWRASSSAARGPRPPRARVARMAVDGAPRHDSPPAGS
ncbi:hypothetical protein ACFXPI_33070 [Streptomyces sp. NPDC059104]|uniref:hypothetical protein n=1 Tax=Streptomyces sp. NPDC059104 TaxID=3346729 RepID=UPI00368089FC